MELKHELKIENEFCVCGYEGSDLIFMSLYECECGINRPHCHCPQCGGFIENGR